MLTASASSATSSRVSRSGQAGRGCGCPGEKKASFSPRRLRSPGPPPGGVVSGGERPGHPVRRRLQPLAPSPRKKTRTPKGPADRVERSSPAIRSPAGPPKIERVTSQTGVPPPHTGQNEMKPGATFLDAGPPGVSARICGCQGAGSASTPAEPRQTPRNWPVFRRAGVRWRGRATGPPSGNQRRQDRYVVERLSTPVLWSTPSRTLVSDSISPATRGSSAQKKRPTTCSRGRLRQE